MDDKEIKSALDSFEDDDFLAAKEKLKAQIVKHRNEYLKGKLGLQKDIDGSTQPLQQVVDDPVKPKKPIKRLMKK